ncbi:MAG: cell division protein FtsA [Alphaproteobacteria bacterium]
MKFRRSRANRRPFAVLDIGSSKMCCMIGDPDRQGGLHLLGQGTHASAGMRGGEISDLEAVSEVIGKTVQAAERDAGISVDSVTVVLPGGRPASQIRTNAITLSDNTVSRRDMRRLMDKTAGHEPIQTHQPMQMQTLPYSLDEVRDIADPRGMRGRELGVNYTVISAAKTSLANFREALALNHLGVDRFIHAGYAAGTACLTEEERDLGSTLIDFGGGTTSLATFMDGKVIYADTVPIGGHHVTTDIARILSIPVADAERLKAVEGSIMPIDTLAVAPSPLQEAVKLGKSDNITLPGLGDTINVGGKVIERNLLSAIIRPRIDEILEMLMSRMAAAKMQHAAGGRLILAGGASQLTGLGDFCATTLDKTVKPGMPSGITGLTNDTNNAGHAAAIGALIHVNRLEDDDPAERQTRTLPHGPIERFGAWLRDNL